MAEAEALGGRGPERQSSSRVGPAQKETPEPRPVPLGRPGRRASLEPAGKEVMRSRGLERRTEKMQSSRCKKHLRAAGQSRGSDSLPAHLSQEAGALGPAEGKLTSSEPASSKRSAAPFARLARKTPAKEARLVSCQRDADSCQSATDREKQPADLISGPPAYSESLGQPLGRICSWSPSLLLRADLPESLPLGK